MKSKPIFSAIALAITLIYTANGQEITQVIRGKIVDVESQTPIAFATVTVPTTHPPQGTITDESGNFRMEKVPVGRHNLQVSFVGFETRVVPEIMVSSGKEMVLNLGLKERITQMEEVVVKAFAKKDKPINSMATVSARTFSVEEAQRYAGGFDDPARLASSFAGVATGYLDDNSIIIRGNAPKGLLWRLEGIEIPNPNHFAGMTTFGGGGVSALSSLMLANSDFFTGAFPAEYGNAMSGVFDIKLRNGNNQKHEHAVQVGALGVDLSSEGPFSKKGRASYLFNYRYSTLGLIKPILPPEANVPIYQDLSFKINLPTKNAGIFSVWGLGADNKIKFEAELDTAEWSYMGDAEFGGASQRMGVVALNNRYIFGQKTYLNTTYALSGDYTLYEEKVMDLQLNEFEKEFIDNSRYRHTLSSTLNHKFGARHTNRTGVTVTNMHYKTVLKYAPEPGDMLVAAVDENSSTMLYQMFTQSKADLSDRFRLNLGIHGQYFQLNQEFILEPRIGITYRPAANQGVSLAYGKHSRVEPMGIYLAEVPTGDGFEQSNMDLRLSKSHHLVFAYDVSLRPHLRLKVEPYVQFLYDIPVVADSSYSTLNMEADWFFTEKLENTGTGTNYGIDVTLERFLKNGLYYLLTGSLFESSYVGGDDVKRNTRFNTGYVVNILAGKEWTLGAKQNKILGVNGRLNLLDGQRTTPINQELSEQSGEIIYDYSRDFEDQKPMVYHLNVSITYRINKKKHASIWSLQVMNALGSPEYYGYRYNYRTDLIEEDAVSVVVPSISYKIEF
jgi:hypothetical protein